LQICEEDIVPAFKSIQPDVFGRRLSLAQLCITLLAVPIALLLPGCATPTSGLATQSPATVPTGGADGPTPSTAQAPATGEATAPLPVFSHVFIIVMENKEASQVVGNSSAPYLNSLAAQYARAANYYGVTHPSLPNYLALTGGSTFGIDSDCTDCFVDADNIASQLEAAGRSWKAYMESMPSACFLGSAAPYAQKHNPFIYYDDVRTDPARCNKIVPFDQLAADLQADQVPDYVWISPNLCNDMHDCSVGTGDQWLQAWVPRILASPAWKDKGVLFITFDEGDSDRGCCAGVAGGQVDTLVISPLAQPGFTSDVAYSHYSLLHTIEAAWGLPLLGQTSCDCSGPMSDFFAAAP
jgi:hypothetical protein